MRPALVLLAALLGALPPLPAKADPMALHALRGGGHVIFLRHAETGPPYPDHAAARLGDCSSQRNLDDKGRAQAATLGQALRLLGIPIGQVLASPFCRTMETAVLAFGRAEPVPALALPDHLDAASHAAMGVALRGLLAAAPRAGANTVLVGHSYHLIAAGGPRPEPQGSAAVLRPDGAGGFVTLALLPPEAWARLVSQRMVEAPR